MAMCMEMHQENYVSSITQFMQWLKGGFSLLVCYI